MLRIFRLTKPNNGQLMNQVKIRDCKDLMDEQADCGKIWKTGKEINTTKTHKNATKYIFRNGNQQKTRI